MLQMEDRLADAKDDAETTKEKLLGLQNDHKNVLDELQKQQHENERLRSGLVEAKFKVETLSVSTTEMDVNMDSMKSDAVRSQRDAADLKQELVEAMAQLEAAWDELGEASTKNFGYQKENAELKAANEDLETSKRKLASQVTSAKELFRKLRDKNTALQRELDGYRSPAQMLSPPRASPMSPEE